VKVGDMVRETYIDHFHDGKAHRHKDHWPWALGVVVEIDPLRAGRPGQREADSQTVEIVILLSTGLRTFADPKRWEVISESR